MIDNILLSAMTLLMVLYVFSRKHFFLYLVLFSCFHMVYFYLQKPSLDTVWLGIIMLASVLINNRVLKSKKGVGVKLKPRPYFYGLIIISVVLMYLLYIALLPELYVIQEKKILMSGANTTSWVIIVMFSFLALFLFKESNE
ncbi:MAG: hypothetical protein JNM93_09895 [Bacteriovoracaceae bacterium]|nr:hypothetical protein [Bacteriovoracaceae bacterium]